MAAHQLAIAKASFSAGLLRPDPTSLAREDISHFHSLLSSVTLQCTPGNVQKCKQWILDNIVQSSARSTALGKYMATLSSSFSGNRESSGPAGRCRQPSVKRMRLHLLYLINDILFHATYRDNNPSVCGKLQGVLVGLFGSAAAFTGSPKHQKKILDLLNLWEEKGYYAKDFMEELRRTAQTASDAGEYGGGSLSSPRSHDGPSAKHTKSTPYVMPAMHGDTSTPWYDLPAGNLMPHIIPNSTRPINPEMIKPLQFAAGSADESLIAAVKDLLDDVDLIYEAKTTTAAEGKSTWDIDELGQPILVDEITGDVLEGEGYYGWSRAFCEKTKRRVKGDAMSNHGYEAGSGSRSSSRSGSGRKRRHSSSDGGSSPNRYAKYGRRRSYSSSRSPSPEDEQHAFQNGYSRTRSRNRSYSESPQPPTSDRRRFELDSRAERNPSRQPDPVDLPSFRPPLPMNSPMMPFEQIFNSSFPPPPPPLNAPVNGQWPPPPPPPGYPPSGPTETGWQAPMQSGPGSGFNNNGWHNGYPAPPGRGGRGNYRGRSWH